MKLRADGRLGKGVWPCCDASAIDQGNRRSEISEAVDCIDGSKEATKRVGERRQKAEISSRVRCSIVCLSRQNVEEKVVDESERVRLNVSYERAQKSSFGVISKVD